VPVDISRTSAIVFAIGISPATNGLNLLLDDRMDYMGEAKPKSITQMGKL